MLLAAPNTPCAFGLGTENIIGTVSIRGLLSGVLCLRCRLLPAVALSDSERAFGYVPFSFSSVADYCNL